MVTKKYLERRNFLKSGKFATGTSIEKTLQGIFITVGGILFGFGFWKLQKIEVKDIYQLIISILMVILLGIVFIEKFSKQLSKMTSKLFIRKRTINFLFYRFSSFKTGLCGVSEGLQKNYKGELLSIRTLTISTFLSALFLLLLSVLK